MKLPVLSIYFYRSRFPECIVITILTVLALTAVVGTGQAGQPAIHARKVIVLDPGHGGHDTGAGSSNDIYEKNVNMAFARILADKLKATYKVRFTRADDYWVDLAHRPAVANNIEADLFLSIHTGACLLHNPGGMLIAYYDSRFWIADRNGPKAVDSPGSKDLLPAWDEESPVHAEKSHYLAELLKKKFLEYDPEINIDIQGMPLLVLQGADLPALLIEIGYLTNPADLQNLQSDTKLAEYADIILTTLDAYFSDELDL